MADDPFPTQHRARVRWEGTREDLRAHRIELAGEAIQGSSMEELGGDPRRADPEAMFVGSLSACHMLWFLDRSRRRRLRVAAYVDDAVGDLDGTRITRVELRPRVSFEANPGEAVVAELHQEAHERCFLANSVSFPVEVIA
jgi:organic hydroperoxide reductase OsmC/OhrA